MALKNPYCTHAQVIAECRNSDISSTVLDDSINSASRCVDGLTGRTFFLHSFTEQSPLYVRESDDRIFGTELWLPYWPVLTLTSVTVAGDEWIEDEDFIVTRSRMLKSLVGDWPLAEHPDDCVVIVGEFGFDQDATTDVPTNIPEAVVRATIMIAANLTGYNQKDVVDQMGMRQTLTDKGIPKDAAKLLGPFMTNGSLKFSV